MKVYTKTGDKGTTALFGGKRVLKSDARIEAYGNVDELNSFLGLIRDTYADEKVTNQIIEIQNTLFVVGSILATEPGNTKVKVPELDENHIESLEQWMDVMDAALPPMRFFVLPGGHQAVSFCHVARTVCRRSERGVIRLGQLDAISDLPAKYLNRLSDYLFVLSRYITVQLNVEEIPWKPSVK